MARIARERRAYEDLCVENQELRWKVRTLEAEVKRLKAAAGTPAK
jgi:hypothetical protein